MQKTIVVEIERKYSHPRFKKLVIEHKKFHVHDEKNEARVGDKVKIIQTRPLSKTKFYRLLTIMEKAK
jgi:small subunit ribosomal protein S17